MKKITNITFNEIINSKKIPIITFIFFAIISLFFSQALKILLLLTIFMQIQILIENRHNNMLTIFNIFFSMYYISILPFYILGKNISAFYSVNFNDIAHERTLLIYCLFALGYYILLKINNNTNKIGKKYNIKNLIEDIRVDNSFIYYLSILMIVVFIFLGNRGQISLFSGSYGTGTSSSSILNEYIIIFFLTAYIFNKGSKKKDYIILGLFFIYSIINFLYGNRIGVIQIGLLMFYLYIDEYINIKKLIIIILSSVFLLAIIGGLRNGTLFVKSPTISNNQTEIYNASIGFFRIVNDGIINFAERIISFILYIIRIVIPTSNLSEIANLSYLVTDATGASLGGGFIAAYVYVWFSYIGVILSGMLLGYAIIKLEKVKNEYLCIIVMIVCSTYPRWLVYDPITLIKLPLYACLVYWGFNKIIINILKYIKNYFNRGLRNE